jgi:hypothetical protein
LAAGRAATVLAAGLPAGLAATAGVATGFVLWAFLAIGADAVFATGFATALALAFAGLAAALGCATGGSGLTRAAVLEGTFVAIR